ncbi:MAG TPA: 2-dehydropantoate 2-reductase N-terminal domain-containing protein, partial [Pseudomonadota bacterium]|nr:2-dehydropantoate 2-reductase N-terminal domain-containing protein [Pseudomonadota bacterium]
MMRVLLVGCGGIGGIVAASLARTGAAVDVVTGNADIQQALLRNGMRVRDLDGQEWATPPTGQVVAQARELGSSARPYELCLLATKTTTLEGALQEVLPLLRPEG